VFTLDLWEFGNYDKLAFGIRKCLDAISVVRRSGYAKSDRHITPSVSRTTRLDAEPINTILSTNGTVRNAIYYATIGRVALLNGTPIGRELGASTWIEMTGTNQHAI